MKRMMKELLMGKLKIKKSSDATIIDWLSREEDNSYVLHIKWCTHSPLILVVGQFIGSSKLGNYELMTFYKATFFRCMCGLAMTKTSKFAPDFLK